MPETQDSAGRRLIDEQDDRRSRAQRDRDRVLYSSAFARLSGVTQVAPSDEGAPYHNRLIHSLKVAQIARRTAEHLQCAQSEAALRAGVDPDSCEAAALAHDLGHPPFGHAAEHCLDKLVSQTDTDGFEGNAQSFRIVVRLAKRRDGQDGLNLTRGTLDAILKYPWLRGESEEAHKHHKYGSYRQEGKEFIWVRAAYEENDDSRSANAEIMDWADDTAYAVHDVEDFFRAGLIPLDRLVLSDGERQRAIDWMLKRNENVSEDQRAAGHFAWTWSPEAAWRSARSLFEDSPISGLKDPYTGLASQRAKLRQATALLIRRYLTEVALQEIDGHIRFLGAKSDHLRQEIDFLKGLVWYYVIERPALRTQQVGQLRVIRELFETYAEAAEARRAALLPVSMQEAIESGVSGPRAAADLIASLTERQAIALWGKISGVDQRSLRDYPVL